MNEPPTERGLVDRWILAIVYAVAFAFVAVALVFFVQLMAAGWWWELPIVAVLAFFTFVLYRNRSRRGAR